MVTILNTQLSVDFFVLSGTQSHSVQGESHLVCGLFTALAYQLHATFDPDVHTKVESHDIWTHVEVRVSNNFFESKHF